MSFAVTMMLREPQGKGWQSITRRLEAVPREGEIVDRDGRAYTVTKVIHHVVGNQCNWIEVICHDGSFESQVGDER